MSNFGKVLKDEVTRISRREVRAQTESLRKSSSGYRHQIAELKRAIGHLQREVTSLGRAGKAKASTTTNPKPTRFVAKGLRALRTRLGLSANDFGALAGVSGQSIYNWEQGKSVPRKAQLSVLVDLRALGKREARERLVQRGVKTTKIPRKNATKH